MIAQIGLAIGVSLVGMVVVGTIVKQFLGLRSAINWLAQTAVLFGAATALGLATLPTAIMVGFPTGIHLLKLVVMKVIEYRVVNGHYGESIKWAYELIEQDQDREFMYAQAALPPMELKEIQVIADSKQELRTLTVERFEELASEDLSDTDFINQL